MYSDTPPEKLIASGLRSLRRGSRRSRAFDWARRTGRLMISNRRSAMRSTIASSTLSSGFASTLVSRPHRNEFSGLGREPVSDGARVAAPDGDPGEDERTRIDRLRIDTGERVLPVYEDAQGGRIDRHIVGRIFDERSEQDFGFVDDFA